MVYTWTKQELLRLAAEGNGYQAVSSFRKQVIISNISTAIAREYEGLSRLCSGDGRDRDTSISELYSVSGAMSLQEKIKEVVESDSGLSLRLNKDGVFYCGVWL